MFEMMSTSIRNYVCKVSKSFLSKISSIVDLRYVRHQIVSYITQRYLNQLLNIIVNIKHHGTTLVSGPTTHI